MKILIIDNEELVRSGLKKMILSALAETPQVEEADGVAGGVQKINAFRPDILFLDIEMEDGTGFDLLNKLENPSFQLIFTTAYNQYAIQAFKFSAIDYLMKPVDPGELQNSLEKATANIRNNDLNKQLAVLMQQLSHRQNHERKIVLKNIDSTYFVKIADILFCRAEGPYTKFYLQHADAILVSKNLKEYESLLEPLGFIRTHHSYLVNTDKIRLFDKTDGGSLLLEDGHSIPVSQRRREWVLELLEGKE